MCITFLYTNPGDISIKYKLVLINNRDEYYSRETANAALNSSGDLHSIYGTDLAGLVKGTWLGVSSTKEIIRVGNLANVIGEDHSGKVGRGPIVTSFIEGVESQENYNENLFNKCQEFSSFNFLSVEINPSDLKSIYVSNTPPVVKKIPLGFVGLGNSPLNTPFKKVVTGTENFKETLERHKSSCEEELLEALMSILKDETKYFPDAELLQRREDAENFSSIHIKIPGLGYGTRTRTVVLVDNENNVDYIEETMSGENPDGEWIKTHLKIASSKF